MGNSIKGSPPMENSVQFEAELTHLPTMLKWIRERLQAFPIEAADRNKFEVASEEILVNIIHYAYKDLGGKIEVQWEEKTPFIHVTFKDFGEPFNPLENQKPLIKSLSLDHKDIGGLGIFFVKNFVDKMEYCYKNGANILTISKRIN